MDKKIKRYVLGAMFSPDLRQVLLIRKNRPEWQKGKLNLLGGKIEDQESAVQAMYREFEEECGIKTTDKDWHYYALMFRKNDFECYCFWAVGDIQKAKKMEDEEVFTWSIEGTLERFIGPINCLENIPWLISLAKDYATNKDKEIIHIEYSQFDEDDETKVERFSSEWEDEEHNSSIFIAPTAVVEVPLSDIGSGTKIWHHAHISPGVKIGENCTIGEGTYVGPTVKIGNNCRIQNQAQLFDGVELGDNVFIGPGVVFTNDVFPVLIGLDEWKTNGRFKKTIVEDNVSIGANSTVLAGITIGEGAVIGCGSNVVKNVLRRTIAHGNPALSHRFIDQTNYLNSRFEKSKRKLGVFPIKILKKFLKDNILIAEEQEDIHHAILIIENENN